jgi:hypothetical protein
MSDELINSNQDDLSFDFHYWKHENKISKLFFEALELRKKIELERLSSLAYSDKNPNDKLIYLGGYTASIML